jgi:hypothetical protein
VLHVFLVVRAREFRLVGVGQPRQSRAEIDAGAGRAEAAEIIQRPDHARCAKVEAGMAIRRPVVERVSRPELLLVEMRLVSATMSSIAARASSAFQGSGRNGT